MENGGNSAFRFEGNDFIISGFVYLKTNEDVYEAPTENKLIHTNNEIESAFVINNDENEKYNLTFEKEKEGDVERTGLFQAVNEHISIKIWIDMETDHLTIQMNLIITFLLVLDIYGIVENIKIDIINKQEYKEIQKLELFQFQINMDRIQLNINPTDIAEVHKLEKICQNKRKHFYQKKFKQEKEKDLHNNQLQII